MIVKREINRIILINAPIDLRYQDSASLFCPPLGLMSIKAYLESKNPEFEVSLLDGMILDINEIIKKMCDYNPDIVGISVQLLSYKNTLKICRIAKEHHALVFFGGHHATQMANKIITNRHKIVDCVICGDGEESIFQICSGTAYEKIPGIVCWDHYRDKIFSKKQVLCNLDDLPNPYYAKDINYTPYINNLRKSNFPFNSGRYYRVYSHKGCKFRSEGKRCVFCGRADEGFRFFSVKKYYKYLSEIGVDEDDFVFDVGDDLCGNIEWMKEAAKYIRENNLVIPKIGIFGRGDEVTKESANLLRRLGVVDVTMGVETGDNNVLSKSEKDIKGAGVCYAAAKFLFENGIGLTPSYVLGLPGETLRSLNNTVKHAKILKELSISFLGDAPGEMVANLLEPIPGSKAFKVLEDVFPNKYLTEDMLELETMQRDYFCTVFSLNNSSYKSFRNELKKVGRIINHLVGFADPQGWLRNEIN